MAQRPTLWDRCFSFVAWAVIAALPVGILKLLWDQGVITVAVLEAGTTPLVTGWALVFLALLVFMWKNERIHRALSERDGRLAALQQEQQRLAKECADAARHLELREQAYRDKVAQLYADIDRQVQRRLLLAQQTEQQQQVARSRLLDLREQRLLDLRENVPLLRELHLLHGQLRALQARLTTDASTRFLPPDELPAAFVALCAGAPQRLLLVSGTVDGRALATCDRGLHDFFARGGVLTLWLAVTGAAWSRTDIPALLDWWQRRGTQVQVYGYRHPVPRGAVSDAPEALVVACDLLDGAPEYWADWAAQVTHDRQVADLEARLQELAVRRSGGLAPLRLLTAVWQQYTGHDDHGLLIAGGCDREVLVDGDTRHAQHAALAAVAAGTPVLLLVGDDGDGRYRYLAHRPDGQAAAAAAPAAAPLPF